MEFVKSNYKFPAEKKKIAAPAGKVKGGPGGLYGNFPSARKRKDDMAYLLERGKSSNRKVNAITAAKLVKWHHNVHRRNP